MVIDPYNNDRNQKFIEVYEKYVKSLKFGPSLLCHNEANRKYNQNGNRKVLYIVDCYYFDITAQKVAEDPFEGGVRFGMINNNIVTQNFGEDPVYEYEGNNRELDLISRLNELLNPLYPKNNFFVTSKYPLGTPTPNQSLGDKIKNRELLKEQIRLSAPDAIVIIANLNEENKYDLNAILGEDITINPMKYAPESAIGEIEIAEINHLNGVAYPIFVINNEKWQNNETIKLIVNRIKANK